MTYQGGDFFFVVPMGISKNHLSLAWGSLLT